MVGLLGTIRAVLYADTSLFKLAFKDAEASVVKTAATVRMASQAMITAGMGIGAAITIPFGLMTASMSKASSIFDLEMRKISNVARLTGGEMKSLSNEIMKMSTSLRETPTNMAKGMYVAAQANLKTAKDIKNLTTEAARIRLATGFEVTTEQSTDILATFVNALGIPVDKIRHLTDTMLRAQHVGRVTFSEMIQNASKASTVFAQAYDDPVKAYTDLFTLMASITQAGESADRTFTGLRNTMVRVFKEGTDPTSGISKFAKSKGFDSVSSMVKSQGLLNFLIGLGEAKGSDLATLMKLNFRIRELTATAAVLRNATKNTKEMMLQMADAGGIVEESINRNKDSAYAWREALKSAWEQLRISFGEAFAKQIVELTKGLIGLLDKFAQMPDWAKRSMLWVSVISGITAAVLLLSGALTGLSSIVMRGGLIANLVGSLGASGGLAAKLGFLEGGGKVVTGLGYLGARTSSASMGLEGRMAALVSILNKKSARLTIAETTALQKEFWKLYGIRMAGAYMNPSTMARIKERIGNELTGDASKVFIPVPGKIGKFVKRSSLVSQLEGDEVTKIATTAAYGSHWKNFFTGFSMASIGKGFSDIGKSLAKVGTAVGSFLKLLPNLLKVGGVIAALVGVIIYAFSKLRDNFDSFAASLNINLPSFEVFTKWTSILTKAVFRSLVFFLDLLIETLSAIMSVPVNSVFLIIRSLIHLFKGIASPAELLSKEYWSIFNDLFEESKDAVAASFKAIGRKSGSSYIGDLSDIGMKGEGFSTETFLQEFTDVLSELPEELIQTAKDVGDIRVGGTTYRMDQGPSGKVIDQEELALLRSLREEAIRAQRAEFRGSDERVNLQKEFLESVRDNFNDFSEWREDWQEKKNEPLYKTGPSFASALEGTSVAAWNASLSSIESQAKIAQESRDHLRSLSKEHAKRVEDYWKKQEDLNAKTLEEYQKIQEKFGGVVADIGLFE